MEKRWNDTDRRNLKYWQKTLYSMGGSWMKEYGAMVECTDSRELKYWERNVIQSGW